MNDSPASRLLNRLERVTQHEAYRYRAICPAHPSRHRTQSLSIRVLPDETLLLKCFAGCGAADIVKAVDLKLSDLFPSSHRPPTEPRHPTNPNHWHALREAVLTLSLDVLRVAIAAEDIAQGREITKQDAALIALCASRIRSALAACQ